MEKGSNPLITDMMGGFVKVGFNPIPVSRAALDGGYIRALAVTSAKHSTLMPQLPMLAESGLPGFEHIELRPAGARRHAAADRRAAEQGIARGPRHGRGAQAHHPRRRRARIDPPEQHAAIIDHEETKWSTVIHGAGITLSQ